MAGFIEMPTKRASSSIDKLSDMGRELVEEMLADGKTYASIIAALKQATDERVSRSALSRYRVTDFEPTRRRVEAARSAATELAALLQDTTSVETKFNATAQGLFDIMLQRVMEAKGADVTKLMREARMFQQVRTNVRRLDNDERRLAMEAERLELDRRELDKKLAEFEARRRAAEEALRKVKPGEAISQEEFDFIQRSIYGVSIPT